MTGESEVQERRSFSWDSVRAPELEKIHSFVSQTIGTTREVLAKDMEKTFLLKLENETPTGSFKVRGALNYLHSSPLIQEKRTRKIVAASTGNHAIGLAWAAKAMNLSLKVIVPEKASERKISKLKNLGAKVEVYGSSLDQSIDFARKNITEEEHFVPSFSPNIVAGHSSLAVELFKNQEIKRVFFPIGVGSGIAGIVLARNHFSPNTEIIGVVPEKAPAWAHSFESGTIVEASPSETIADGLRTAKPDARFFEFLKGQLGNIITVSESEIVHAREVISKYSSAMSEATGAVGLAGLLKMGNQKGDATVVCG